MCFLSWLGVQSSRTVPAPVTTPCTPTTLLYLPSQQTGSARARSLGVRGEYIQPRKLATPIGWWIRPICLSTGLSLVRWSHWATCLGSILLVLLDPLRGPLAPSWAISLRRTRPGREWCDGRPCLLYFSRRLLCVLSLSPMNGLSHEGDVLV